MHKALLKTLADERRIDEFTIGETRASLAAAIQARDGEWVSVRRDSFNGVSFQTGLCSLGNYELHFYGQGDQEMALYLIVVRPDKKRRSDAGLYFEDCPIFSGQFMDRALATLTPFSPVRLETPIPDFALYRIGATTNLNFCRYSPAHKYRFVQIEVL